MSVEWQEPPEGWFTFGTHIDQPIRLEFSTETGEDGIPLWERPLVSQYRCKHCGRVVKRESNKAWIKSWCDKTQRNVHLIRVKS
jgi:hypothetical protein